ncbi:YebC/PmpR family DNA-binding transcriptional regulator [Candidatus Woesebacteria bacterium]|nr:MAG: YebC/PmpR family DNA-binding transcriptional regulator [Candidatus Woesebacteria bacterium]
MSGHSKWSTIKHKKEATDFVRGRLFSRLSRAITIAIKAGGGPNPETNYRLRVAIETARNANMPKSNIERVLAKAESAGDMYEARYEGFTPGGAGVLVDVVTDNKNRSAQEIKQVFERNGGQFATPGAVSFNFESKGLLTVEKTDKTEDQILNLIDLNPEDVIESESNLEVYVKPDSLHEIKQSIEAKGYKVMSASLIQKPKMQCLVTDKSSINQALALLELLENHEDVQAVFTNLDIPDELAPK